MKRLKLINEDRFYGRKTQRSHFTANNRQEGKVDHLNPNDLHTNNIYASCSCSTKVLDKLDKSLVYFMNTVINENTIIEIRSYMPSNFPLIKKQV